MKKFSILFLITLLIAVNFNCDKDETVTNNTSDPDEISGVIENWDSGRMNLKAVVNYFDINLNEYTWQTIDSTYIQPDNSFRLRLDIAPVIRDEDSLLLQNYYSCSGSISVSPSNTKIKHLFLYIYDSGDTAIGSISRSDTTLLDNPEYIVQYKYVNNDCSIMGTRTCLHSQFTSYSTATTYNWTGNIGWNRLFYYHMVDTPLTVQEYTNNDPGNLKWWYNEFLLP